MSVFSADERPHTPGFYGLHIMIHNLFFKLSRPRPRTPQLPGYCTPQLTQLRELTAQLREHLINQVSGLGSILLRPCPSLPFVPCASPLLCSESEANQLRDKKLGDSLADRALATSEA